MKQTYLILVALLVLTACGGDSKKSVEEIISEGNLEAIRSKKTALTEQYKAVSEQLKKLDEAIDRLDTVKKLQLITVLSVKDTLFNHYVELQGSVDTKQNIIIYSEFGGLLYNVLVKEGQKVKKGQILARIDDGGLSQQLAQMQVQANLAKTTYERQKRLWEQNIGSEIQFLQAKSSYEAQEKAIEQMKNQLSKAEVRAPFAGSIDDVMAEQGTVVTPGMSLFRIVSLSDMHIEAEVPEIYLTSIVKNTKVKVEFPIIGESVDTKVQQVGSYINPNNRSFKIEIPVPNTSGNVKPNLTSRLLINDYTSQNAILLPQNVISENALGEQYVYTVEYKNDNGRYKAVKKIVETGKTQGDLVEILSGIKTGDQVIIEGARSVKDGQEVSILKNEAL
ncbi:efflux RND transporter periplasmic adaptor subunit [Ascidiimonas aurantiaca]|uniref:efflux RND transporter periplasmic adaptor subunit n=1 Tax=Ascidiimonas aurantiaca TaxID=1685432 RepID=UPI0030EF78D7